MKIEQIEIRYLRKQDSGLVNLDGVAQVKSLPWISVVQAKIGSYRIRIGQKPEEDTGCEGFFIAPAGVMQNILHIGDPATHLSFNRWIFLDVVINGKYRIDDLYDFPVTLENEQRAEMDRLFDDLFAGPGVCDDMVNGFRILRLLLSVAREKPAVADDRMLAVADYIRAHYAEDLDVPTLARMAHMSESHFYARFRAVFGQPPLAYLNHYRLALASDALRTGNAPVREIAASVGFSDPYYFSRAFRTTFEVSPRTYREYREIEGNRGNGRLTVRHAREEDLPALMTLYAGARARMKADGNPTQWGDNWPPEDLIREDIRTGVGYVIEDGDRPAGCFMFGSGPDPTYAVIEDGAWRNDAPYGVIHRIAGDGVHHGILRTAVTFALACCDDLRADTHENNRPMQGALAACGFRRVGRIYVGDGTPRIAYHLVKNDI